MTKMDTTNVIPKKDMENIQQWQPDSLDSSDTQETSETVQTNKSSDKDEPIDNESTETKEQELTEPLTKNQENQVFQQAQEKGYLAGFAVGRVAGYQEGKQNADTEIKDEIKRVQEILSELDHELHLIDQKVAQDLLALALDLAKKMITKSFQIQPELVLPVVQEAIRQLPHATQHPCLFLHPDDASLVSNHLSEDLSQSEWKICKDEKIERGGCRIEAGGNEVDASLSTRWQRILATIGQEDNWLA